MKEEYLHYIWKSKRFRSNELTLTDGRRLTVHNVGWHNHDAGPDFFNGTISVDGLTWNGNIELHLSSSDWYRHNHQNDEAYDNVVLHVVLEHDKDVFIENRKLPTLSLKDQIDPQHLKNYERLSKTGSNRPCSSWIQEENTALKEQVEIAFFHRIERKGLELLSEVQQRKLPTGHVLYYAIAKALGGRLNKEPMQELIARIPTQCIQRERWDIERVEAIIFGVAGFLSEGTTHPYFNKLKDNWSFLKRKYNLSTMNVYSWKFKGVRPTSFPPRRLAELCAISQQLSSLQVNCQSLEDVKALEDRLFNIELNDFWKSHYSLSRKAKKENLSTGLSNLAKINIKVNALGPYFIFRKHFFGEHEKLDLVLDLFSSIKPESNSVMKQWSSLNVRAKNALESQGLLELNNEFCIFRKCLDCRVGKSILESEEVQ